MATPPESDLFEGDHSCFSFHDFCGDEHVDQRTYGAAAQPLQANDPQDAQTNEMKETEDFLAATFMTLSAQERNEALDDVHCVGEELQETPEKTHKSLVEFHQLVQATRTPIYESAANQNPAYVEDPSFRLMFLRANSYDAGTSVHQMMNLLQQKAIYFGIDTVAREITLYDLNEEDQRILLSMCHILERRDQMGRVICVWFPYLMVSYQDRVESLIRALYYLSFNVLLRIPEVQTKGLVSVDYDMTTPGKPAAIPGIGFLLAVTSFISCLPFRYSATHCCLQASGGNFAMFNAFLGLVYRAIPKHATARIRIHYSSHMELHYQLRGYGIPTDDFPIDMDGNIREDIVHRWFYKHVQNVQLQQAPQQGPQAAAPGQQVARAFSEWDVLLGRGRLVQYHPGNVRFRQILESQMEEYDGANRARRRQMAENLVRELRATGVRFLRSDEDDVWIENGFEDSVDKVTQFYRTKRRSIKTPT